MAPSLHATQLVVLLAIAVRGLAYPYYWVDPQTNGDLVRQAPACTVHPDSSQHGDHPTTSPDSTMAILLQLGSAPVTSLCPGQSYTTTVTWPGAPRRALVTASYGQFASNTPTGRNNGLYDYVTGTSVPNCPGRVIAKPSPSFTDTLTLPCDSAGALQVFVTSTDGQTSILQQASVTYPLDPACATPACQAPTGASPPPGAVVLPPPPSPLPPPLLSTSAVTSPPGSAPPGPALSSTATLVCPASHLNYTCAQRLGGVTLHFTVGGPAPINQCTGTDGGTLPAGFDTGAGLLHMAVEATTTGYVSVAFAQTANVMALADAILGWATPEGEVYVQTFLLEYQDLTEANARPWASFMGVMRADENVTVCFTRPLDHPVMSVAKDLTVEQDITLNWATCPTAILKPHNAQGGGTLNLATGAVTEADSAKIDQIRWHGALMAAGWALLLPLGYLMPAHRWVFRGRKMCGAHVWFWLHVGLQCLGFAIITAGFAIAWYFLQDPGVTGGDIGKVHQILGTIVYALACVQLLAGFFRPGLDSKIRPYFTHGHRLIGRVAVSCAWAVIYLGIYLFHTGVYKEKLAQWVVPVAVSMGVILLVDVCLAMWASQKGIGATESTQDSNVVDKAELGLVEPQTPSHAHAPGTGTHIPSIA